MTSDPSCLAMQMAEIKGVVFDIFGTLVQKNLGRNPYLQLFRLAKNAGRKPKADDAIHVMTHSFGIVETAAWLGLSLPIETLAAIESDMQADLDEIQLYGDARAALLKARKLGLRIGVCSNLAAPYGTRVRALLHGDVDEFVFSFSVGAVKPASEIYTAVCDELGLSSSDILFIGDTHVADVAGPRENGMKALHLARNGESPDQCFARNLHEIFS